MKTPDDEKEIIDFLIKTYPTLETLKTKGGRFNKSKVKQILDIIDTDENLIKYHTLIGLYNIRKENIKDKKDIKNEKSNKDKMENISEIIVDNNTNITSDEININEIEQINKSWSEIPPQPVKFKGVKLIVKFPNEVFTIRIKKSIGYYEWCPEKEDFIIEFIDNYEKQFTKRKGYDEKKGLEILDIYIPFKNKNLKKKGEVQEHGFFWEKHILIVCFGIPEEKLKEIGYTSKYDLPKKFIDDKFNISCKCSISLNDVNMGDPIRLYDSVNNPDEKIHLIIFFWKQEGNFKNVIKTYEIDITDKKVLLFGDITKKDLEDLRDKVREVPNKRSPTAEERKVMYEFRDKLHEKKGALRLDIKCNSQQSRIQCTIHNFTTKFIVNKTLKIIEENDVNKFRNKEIPKYEGGGRVFNKKPQ